MASPPLPVTEEFTFGDWHFYATYTKAILPSVDPCSTGVKQENCDFCFYKEQLNELPQWPEMIFPRNKLIIKHVPTSANVEFNCIDALKFVDPKQDWVKVACTQEWADARSNCEFIKNTIKPYDWTYSTNYVGTCSNFKSVVGTDERANIQKLMLREKILFFQEISLYEDELADHGCSNLTLKFRCMPSCFFALLRFYLRVDNVLVKINDTRLYWEHGKPYIIREYSSKQKFYAEMKADEKEKCLDANEMSKYLDLIEEKVEKLTFI